MFKFILRSFLDFLITTDGAYSTHQLDFNLLVGHPQNSVSRFTLQFLWPILAKGIVSSLNSDKSIKIIAKKCVDDPWPGKFGGRSKWDINILKPWNDIEVHGFLHDHMEAQFECENLFYMKRFTKLITTLSPLDEVREIIQAIFYSVHNNSFQLFAIYGPGRNQAEDPTFFFRIHPTTVRLSPHGSPLLLVSVIDYPRLEELIVQGKIDREAFQSEYHRLVTERVSKEVCIIQASTLEELSLLRYVLRVNSTKMRRSAWQSKNLPRGNDHPWIPSFISPLYTELINGTCASLDQENFSYSNPLPGDRRHRKSCACCFVTKILLKKCSRCQSVFYCSTLCQRNHWSIHKFKCATHSFSN